MAFRNIRPLHILWQESTVVGMLDGVSLGITRILSLAGVLQNFQLKYFVQRRQSDWLTKDGKLNPYQSLDWHIEWARRNSKKALYLNSTALLNSLQENPAYQAEPRYELVVVNEPLYWSDSSIRTVGGIGRHGQGAIITIGHHLRLLQPVNGESDKDKKKRESDFRLFTQMLTMHELGHVFGVFPGTSKEDPTDEELLEAHCPNECVMHFSEDANRDKKIIGQPFCPSCLEKLKEFFLEP